VPTDRKSIPHGLFLVILEEELAADPKQSVEAALDTAEGAAALATDLDAYIVKLKQELRAKRNTCRRRTKNWRPPTRSSAPPRGNAVGERGDAIH